VKVLSICLILVGFVWALGVGWMFLVLSGIAEPISFVTTSLYYMKLLVGPMLLIVGPILVLNGSQAKLGAVLTMIGCAILTVLVGYNTIGDFHTPLLQAKPPYIFDACVAILTLAVDFAAFRLSQLVFATVLSRR
jgi:hypothetical protein